MGIFSHRRACIGVGLRGLGVETIGQVQHQRDQPVHVRLAPGHGFGNQPAPVRCGACIPHTPQVDTSPQYPRGRLGVGTVPENVRDRPVLRRRARGCRVRWFTAGENIPNRPSPPNDARSEPCHGASRHGESNGGLPARCAPRSRWSIVTVAFTTTQWRGWESSSSAMDALIPVKHARITVTLRGGEVG